MSLGWLPQLDLVSLRSDQPGGRSAGGFAIRVGPVERRTAPRLDIDAEMSFVPTLQRRRILCLEEDAADAGDPLHVNLRCPVVWGGARGDRARSCDHRPACTRSGWSVNM